MKKLLLLVFMLSAAAFSSYSQNLVLSNLQGNLPTNAFITQVGTPDSVELITYLYVKNTGASTINVFCKKVEVKKIDSVETTMCWAGGCYPSFVNVSPNAAPILSGQTITDFVGHYTWAGYSQPGFKPGESIVRWVFYNEANANDSASVTIKYTSWPVGLDEITSREGTLSAAYPNPAGETTRISYTLPEGSQGAIMIRNLVGATVQTEQLRSGSGTITFRTSSLNDGIYFYSLVVDGKPIQTKKLVVRH